MQSHSINPKSYFQHCLENPQAIGPYKKQLAAIVATMALVAFATLGAIVWNITKNKPWDALVMGISGALIEGALIILLTTYRPKRVTPLEINFVPTPGLKALIEQLETCYPIQAVDQKKTLDQQKGGMTGQALGDAIGLFTEFTTKKEAVEMIDGKPILFDKDYPGKFDHGYNWEHIVRFIKNGWTDDTDQAFALLRALYRDVKMNKGKTPFATLFAQEMRNWLKNGLKTEAPFLGREHPYCMGLGALVSTVLSESSFDEFPKQTAEGVWAFEQQKPLQNRPAANGAIMRTAPIGLICYQSFSDIIYYTREACHVTHADPRCTASCVALTVAIALSLRGYDSQKIIEGAEKAALEVLKDDLNRVAEKHHLSIAESKNLETLYLTTAADLKAHLHGDWSFLDLDEGWKDSGKINKIGYTFKCMGAAFYALKLADQCKKTGKTDIFRKIIEEIAAEGGDADTNGAAAGALVGAFLGYQGQFPLNWTSKLADQPVLEQGIQHIAELTQLYTH